MCGIFGIISQKKVNKSDLNSLASHARQRGRDSSGIIYYQNESYFINRENFDIKKLLQQCNYFETNIIMGHSRLVTNGLNDNQPVVRDGVIVIHNGIIVNSDEVWKKINLKRTLHIDSEAINGVAISHFAEGGEVSDLPKKILSICKGTISCVIILVDKGKAILFSNNGSLFSGEIDGNNYFSSEKYARKN